MAEQTTGEVRLFFVPTAADVEENKFFVCKSMDDLAAVGLNPIWYPLKIKTRAQIKSDLAQADIIWVNGGNTFYLLDVARKTGFMEIVENLVRNKGVMYGGVSAGTILASPTIELAGVRDLDGDKNDVGLTDLTSFGFVDFITHVHYNVQKEKSILEAMQKFLPVYALSDGTAIEVNDGVITLHGEVERFA